MAPEDISSGPENYSRGAMSAISSRRRLLVSAAAVDVGFQASRWRPYGRIRTAKLGQPIGCGQTYQRLAVELGI
jgi:hypothetical protein